ncbi:MAG: hypothetical protein ACP5VC_18465 [Bryobacteraceae bacterium]
MTAPAYSLAAWRKYREEREQPKQETELTLADTPADAKMDARIVIGFWNGERFVSWEKWLATAPIIREESKSALPDDARLVTAVCGDTRVWLARDGDRWLMYAGSRHSRRRDFASPYLAHAVRTAEAWYGPAAIGWRVERER